MRALLHGLPGHPVHPPLTDATIGAYTVATVLAVLAAFGVAEAKLAPAWWITLIVGLVFNAPTSPTGLTAGGWIGGSIVFAHGMRVEAEPERPAGDAIVPGKEETREA